MCLKFDRWTETAISGLHISYFTYSLQVSVQTVIQPNPVLFPCVYLTLRSHLSLSDPLSDRHRKQIPCACHCHHCAHIQQSADSFLLWSLFYTDHCCCLGTCLSPHPPSFHTLCLTSSAAALKHCPQMMMSSQSPVTTGQWCRQRIPWEVPTVSLSSFFLFSNSLSFLPSHNLLSLLFYPPPKWALFFTLLTLPGRERPEMRSFEYNRPLSYSGHNRASTVWAQCPTVNLPWDLL